MHRVFSLRVQTNIIKTV